MSYFCLNRQVFTSGEYSIVPIRSEDRYLIMNWRNEQLYHLRQTNQLTKGEQDYYFDTTISGLFQQEKPDQILFSFLKNNECIGYGGLVHINWRDKNAEISFLMDTILEHKYFQVIWRKFLFLIEGIVFDELAFHKAYVYAFDLRPHLYEVLLASGYFFDARLKDHCKFQDRYADVVIHSKLYYR